MLHALALIALISTNNVLHEQCDQKNNHQISIEVAHYKNDKFWHLSKKLPTRKMIDFDTFTKIA